MAEQTLSTLMTRFRANATSSLRIACVAGVCLVGVGVPTAHASEQDYADAVRQFKTGRLAEAYGHFMVLANRGDADAARIGIFLHKFGPALYGRHWDLTPHEEKAWEMLAKSGKARQDPPSLSYLNPLPEARVTLHGTEKSMAGSELALTNSATQ